MTWQQKKQKEYSDFIMLLFLPFIHIIALEIGLPLGCVIAFVCSVRFDGVKI